ncbi:DeoR/GlpR family DNA-binding transcription regulator [Polymorphospora sp. NPDC050346]|uniref:DeoR/GlpR family DNA-binding transcription regulator n=1 Tax=Polymorphospora sp. NPDC050346 TaxID=3155780 RepID=UPI0033C7AC62
MDVQERQRRIEQTVATEEAVTVADLAARLATSEATIRRDLIELDHKGVLRRVHGGARRLALRGAELSYASRAAANVDAKARIATAVADRLGTDEAVLLDSGTTCVEIARAVGDRPLRVMPLSLTAANVLAGRRDVRLICPGGEVRAGELAFVGPLAEAGIRRLRFDTAVVSGCGASVAGGVTAYDLGDAAVKTAAIDCAERVILVFDRSKWEKSTFAWVADLKTFDLVVTDHRFTAAESAFFERNGVEVVAV